MSSRWLAAVVLCIGIVSMPARAAEPVPVHVVLFSDFQCPFCAQFAGPFRELQQKGLPGADITVEFKHFPLTMIHPAALLAHRAALAAQAQGKFWEMHDLLFAHQAQLQRVDLLGYARLLQLDVVRFERDMDGETVARVIEADLAEGRRIDIGATPTFLINGQQYTGARTLAQLKALVEMEIRAPHTLPVATGTTVSAPTPLSGEFEITLYSDFQCPFCQQFAPAIRDLQGNGADGAKVTVHFKNFPLSIHPNAQLAHQAAMAAQLQGKFWEMHDLLFANPARAQRSDVIAYAKELGLNVSKFQKDMDSEAVKRAISADVEEGTRAGIGGTPSFTINGKMYVGARTATQIREMLVGEQRRARALAEVPLSLMTRGPSDVPVVIELFADLASPVTVPTIAVINQMLAVYPDRLKLQFRNFPLAFHPNAPLAHEAAIAASKDGRFWEVVEYVLAHQESLREQDLIAYAGSIGIDPAVFASALADHRYAGRVQADLGEGQSRGVFGSPSLFVGDKRIDGVPSADLLRQYIDEALASRRAPAR